MARPRNHQGLTVTVKPSASAYFAGEQFTATITFTNSHPAQVTRPPPPPPPHLHSRTASSINLTSWTASSNSRKKPPNASHLGLAEYATNHLDSDQVPPSPFFGSTSGQFQPFPRSPSDSSRSRNYTPPPPTVVASNRPSFTSSLSNPHNPSPLERSVSNGSNNPSVPNRKGLIGMPSPRGGEPSTSSVPLPPSRSSSGGGLYAGGPRRPGGGGNHLLRASHGRTQSMAVNSSSSPDLQLLARNPSSGSGESNGGYRSTSSAGHLKSRFGGSVAGFMNGIDDEPSRRRTSGHVRAEDEDQTSSPVESTTPNYHEDAAFPISTASSSPAPPAFPRRPTFGHQRVPSSHFYNRSNSRAGLSTLSLADSDDDSDYDPNDDSQHLPVNGFYGLGRNDTMDSVVECSLNASYGRGGGAKTGPLFSQRSSPQHSRTAAAPARTFDHDPMIPSHGGDKREGATTTTKRPSNTIALLWAFAHLEGSFEVDDTLIKPNEFLEVKQLLAGGVGGVGVGGGTLEPKKKEGGGWKSWLWGSAAAQQDEVDVGSTRLNESGSVANSSETGGPASLEERKEKAVKDKSVPIFSCPASILGVDLVLEPGESKSFSFSIRLPADLPPSFRGKAIKFNYQLVVGSNRVSMTSANPNMTTRMGSVSRVMRVPLRIYNHVGVTGARPFYDLTNPVIYQRDEAIVSPVDDETKVAPARRKTVKSDVGRPEFESFASNLLSSIAVSPEFSSQKPFPHLSSSVNGGRNTPRSIMDVRPEMRPEMSSHRGGEAFGIDLDTANGCKSAVEIVSRNSQKVSYDINKDGYLVAQLTLVKSAYRLGETVNGSVMINSGEGRVLRVSARLETHELVETSISARTAPQTRQMTRRLHSEHHEATLDSARVGFALAIPSGATPDFGTSGVKLQWSVRLSFLVIPPSPDAPPLGGGVLNPNLTPRRDPPPSSSSNGGRAANHGRSKSFAYGFEPAVPLTLPPAPSIAPSGAAHLMPVSSTESAATTTKPAQYTSYRAVPDLGFVPVLFSSSQPDPPRSPGPLQKTAAGAMHRPNSPSMSLTLTSRGDPFFGGGRRTVLVPAKVETVECSIPIKVYPGNTPFKPTVTVFEA
ncbi:hypothetical protein JCM3766R1_000093 [Sporobolomyces carnicolor]